MSIRIDKVVLIVSTRVLALSDKALGAWMRRYIVDTARRYKKPMEQDARGKPRVRRNRD